MIRAGDIIKHIKALDVCFLVSRIQGPYGSDEKVQITGDWINLGFVNSYMIGERTKIKTTINQLRDWQVCLTPSVPCLRYADWK